jgi:multiple sugar transport system permease protein
VSTIEPTRDHEHRREPSWIGLAWISPWLVGFVVFMAMPIVRSFTYSLADYPLLEPPVPVGLANYRELLHDPVFGRVLLNTIAYTAISVPLGTILAVLIAGALHRAARGAAIFRAAIFLPSLVPLVAAAVIWRWLFNGELGLVNRLIEAISPLPGPDWLGQGAWAMTALILMSLWGVGPAVVITLAALRDVPRSLLDAAALDGVTGLRRFRHVTLPMISPVVLFNVVIAVINAWQIFAVPYVMTGGGPDRATYFYSMYLYDVAFDYGRMGYASAMAWIQLLLVLAITLVVLRMSRRLVFYRGA